MLRYRLTHPQILHALASAGHGSRVLVSDGHYPHSTATGPNAEVVYLNLRPGWPLVTDVLEVLLDAVHVESATTMAPTSSGPPPDAVRHIASTLPAQTPTRALERQDFYDAVRSRDTALLIATGDQRTYANVLLTLGVVDVATDGS